MYTNNRYIELPRFQDKELQQFVEKNKLFMIEKNGYIFEDGEFITIQNESLGLNNFYDFIELWISKLRDPYTGSCNLSEKDCENTIILNKDPKKYSLKPVEVYSSSLIKKIKFKIIDYDYLYINCNFMKLDIVLPNFENQEILQQYVNSHKNLYFEFFDYKNFIHFNDFVLELKPNPELEENEFVNFIRLWGAKKTPSDIADPLSIEDSYKTIKFNIYNESDGDRTFILSVPPQQDNGNLIFEIVRIEKY